MVDDGNHVLESLQQLLPMCDAVKTYNSDKAKVVLDTQDFGMANLRIMGVNGYKF